jgi:hypothetical protein
LDCRDSASNYPKGREHGVCEKGLKGKEEMPEVREEDMREVIPISMKPLVPAIPTDDEELWELLGN